MNNRLSLEILTPEKQALQKEVDAVYLEGSMGRLGILPMHTPLIANLAFGRLDYFVDGKAHDLLCGEGVVEVNNDKVTILARSAEHTHEIDIERAKRALERAKSRRDSKAKDIDMFRAEAALYRAIQRLRHTGHPM